MCVCVGPLAKLLAAVERTRAVAIIRKATTGMMKRMIRLRMMGSFPFKIAEGVGPLPHGCSDRLPALSANIL